MWEEGGAGRHRKGGGEGGCGAGAEVIGDDDGALVTTLTLRAVGAQDGRTPLSIACQEGHEEVVKLLLADVRVDVNQASQVCVGGEGEGAWRELAWRAARCGTERRACHGGGRQKLTSAGRRV